MKKCPYCAEEIQDAAIVCRYCGRDLPKPNPIHKQTKQQAVAQASKPNNSLISRFGRPLLFVLIACLSCGFISFIGSLLSPGERETPTATERILSAVEISTFTAVPSTNTPNPTKTLRPSPTPNVGMINEPREAGGVVVTVLNVTNMVKMDFLTAEQGYIYLVADVTIQNVGRNEDTPYNPLYFSVKDSDGYEYNASLFTIQPSLKSGDLPKGDMVRGYVAFEVRSTSEEMILTYEPLVLLGGYEPIRIALYRVLTTQTGQGTSGSGACELCTFECPLKQGETEYCVTDPGLVIDRNQFEGIVKDYCNAKGGFCKLLIWNDLTYLPASIPMTDLQINNQVADYTKNPTSGIECLRLLAEGNVIYSSSECQ